MLQGEAAENETVTPAAPGVTDMWPVHAAPDGGAWFSQTTLPPVVLCQGSPSAPVSGPVLRHGCRPAVPGQSLLEGATGG